MELYKVQISKSKPISIPKKPLKKHDRFIKRTKQEGDMRFVRAGVLTFLTMLCLVSFSVAGEEEVLKSLEEVKSHIEGGVNPEVYNNLVAKAKAEIQLYKRHENVNPAFLKHAKKSFTYYKFALIPTVYEKDHVLFDLWGNAEDELELAHKSLKKKEKTAQ